MASAKRVGDEPAYILHQYDWSESSLILEVFTRHRGRVALAAKGVKRHTSNFRPVLLPLQPLKLSYTLGAEGMPRFTRSRARNGRAAMSCPRAMRCGRACT